MWGRTSRGWCRGGSPRSRPALRAQRQRRPRGQGGERRTAFSPLCPYALLPRPCASLSHAALVDKVGDTALPSAPLLPALCTSSLPLCTSSLPLCTSSLPLCTASLPLCTASLPLCTSSLPLCTSSLPLCTSSLPLCTASLPLCTSSLPLCAALSCALGSAGPLSVQWAVACGRSGSWCGCMRSWPFLRRDCSFKIPATWQVGRWATCSPCCPVAGFEKGMPLCGGPGSPVGFLAALLAFLQPCAVGKSKRGDKALVLLCCVPLAGHRGSAAAGRRRRPDPCYGGQQVRNQTAPGPTRFRRLPPVAVPPAPCCTCRLPPVAVPPARTWVA